MSLVSSQLRPRIWFAAGYSSPNRLFKGERPLLRSKPYYSTKKPTSARNMTTKDWNASQYTKFEDERTLPARDLVARIPLQSAKHIVDLGCGPGNSTGVLATRYPDAHLVGIDSSPDMIQKAKTALPGAEFSVMDLKSYTPPTSPPTDIFFSNAVLHWLGNDERITMIKALMKTQSSGGVFAFQVPYNLTEPSHALMREVAENGPWSSVLKDVSRDTFQTPQEIYDQLVPLSSKVDIFKTEYYHSLENHQAIVEWVKSTGLRPYVDPLQPQDEKAFLTEYLKRLEVAYPKSFDGRVLLRYPRLFVVATKK